MSDSSTNLALDSDPSQGIIQRTRGLLGQTGSADVRRRGRRRHMSGQCTAFGDLALKYNDLTDDENLVQFFSEVLGRRDDLDKE